MADNFRIEVIADLNVAVSTENIQKQLNNMKGLTVKVDKIDFGKNSLDGLESMSRNLSSIFSTVAKESLEGSKGFAELNKSIDSVNTKAKNLKKTLTSIGNVPGVVQLAEQIQLAQKLIGHLDKSTKDAKSSMKGLVATTKQLKQTTGKSIKSGGFSKDLLGLNIDKEQNNIIKLKNQINDIKKTLGSNIGSNQKSFLTNALRQLEDAERALQSLKRNAELTAGDKVDALSSQRININSIKENLKKQGLLGNTVGLKFDEASINKGLVNVGKDLEAIGKVELQPFAGEFKKSIRDARGELNSIQREFNEIQAAMKTASGAEEIQRLNAAFENVTERANKVSSVVKLLSQELGTGFKITGMDQINKMFDSISKNRQKLHDSKMNASTTEEVQQIEKELNAIDALEKETKQIKEVLSTTANPELLVNASLEFENVEGRAKAATTAIKELVTALNGNAGISALASTVDKNVKNVEDSQAKLREFNMNNGYLDNGKMGKKASNLMGEYKQYIQDVEAFKKRYGSLDNNSTYEEILAVRNEAERLANVYKNLESRQTKLFAAGKESVAKNNSVKFTNEDIYAEQAKLNKRIREYDALLSEPSASGFVEQIEQEKLAIEQEISALDRLAASRKRLNGGAGVGKANNDWTTSKQNIKGINTRADSISSKISKSGINATSADKYIKSLETAFNSLDGISNKGKDVSEARANIEGLIAKLRTFKETMSSGDPTAIRNARESFENTKLEIDDAIKSVQNFKRETSGNKTGEQLLKEVEGFEKLYGKRITDLKDLNSKYKKSSSVDGSQIYSESNSLMAQYAERLNDVAVAREKYNNAESESAKNEERIGLEDKIKRFKELGIQYDELIQKEKRYRNAGNIDAGYNKAIDRITSAYSSNKVAIDGNAEALGKYQDLLKGLNDRTIPFNEINGKVLEFQTYLNNAGLTVDSFGVRLKKAFTSKVLSQFSYMGWMMIMSSMRELYTNVVSVDTAMTELRKVTDATASEYDAFLEGAEARAKSLGATMTETINATADWARLGYSMDEASRLADASLIYQNVGDDIESIDEASSSLISTLQGFGMASSDVMTIVDEFNEVLSRDLNK